MIIEKELDDLGLPPAQLSAAKHFIKDNENLMIDKLRSDFVRWNAYVPKTVDIRELNYSQFIATIQEYGIKGIAPHPIYDDGNLSISEFMTWEECELFPIENKFCVCNDSEQIIKYRQNGFRVFLICDRSKLFTNDFMRIAGFLLKKGVMSFWNAEDNKCGTTKDKDGAMMDYINAMPDGAKDAMLNLLNESKTNENKQYSKMKNVKRINESQLRAIVAESVKKVLNEAYKVGEFDYPKEFNMDYAPIRLSNDEFNMADSYFHIVGNKAYMFKRLSSGDVDVYAMNGERLYDIRRFLKKRQVNEQEQQLTFGDYFNRSKDYHIRNGRKYGFELRKDGEWKYGDIEYDPNAQTMSCMGVSINVQPNMTILDAEEDLFEALLNAGYDTDF